MKVLIADDEYVTRLMLDAALREHGCEPIEAVDGRSAWDMIIREEPQIVISDWVMPEITGLDLCQRVRDQAGHYVYFILLTNRAPTRSNREMALRAGVDDFLTKPINPEELAMRLGVARRLIGFADRAGRIDQALPSCRRCRRVANADGEWCAMEVVVPEGEPVAFTYTDCPECAAERARVRTRSSAAPF
ncbi:response regulator [Actomonas aquatica]|uniref:Response regulator n=1 Tax=Actomonas aquatica TaxID=2866162 RepID=A0ABZ1C2T4_9BACT|nr:response regulator [Opitutus sp. WL0086]WRQ85622.1 response regulator [Opitutus sp. WL0086]